MDTDRQKYIHKRSFYNMEVKTLRLVEIFILCFEVTRDFTNLNNFSTFYQTKLGKTQTINTDILTRFFSRSLISMFDQLLQFADVYFCGILFSWI